MKTKQKYWSATLVSCERRPSGCVALFLKSAIVKTVYTPAYVTNYIIATKKLTRMVSEMAKKVAKKKILMRSNRKTQGRKRGHRNRISPR